MKTYIYLVNFLIFFNIGHAQNLPFIKAKYAILVPMKDESTALLKTIDNKTDKTIDGIHYIEGSIRGKPIVFANTGLGKTNVSIVTTRIIHDYHPEFIFLAGSAGSVHRNMAKNSIVVGIRVMDADLGTLTEQGPSYPMDDYFSTPQKENALMPKFYAPNPKLMYAGYYLARELTQKKIILGSIATSDVLPNPSSQNTLLKLNGIDVIEMEGASFMQTCWLFNANCIVVRTVSNNADEGITEEDTVNAGSNATFFVSKMIDFLSKEAKNHQFDINVVHIPHPKL